MSWVHRLAVGLSVAATIAGCAAPNNVDTDESFHTEQDIFEDEDVLLLPLAQSPSGSASFDFCRDPRGGANLTTMAWLNFVSANAYAHFGYQGPLMNELGFLNRSKVAGVDRMWDRCGFDLKAMRQFELDHSAALQETSSQSPSALLGYLDLFTKPGPESWGRCARYWYRESGYYGEAYPAAAMEQWLLGAVRDGDHLQFFSLGEYRDGGQALDRGSTQAMFALHSELPVAIIAFRGTEPDETADLAADALAFQVDVAPSWGRVHKGFLDAYNEVADPIVAKVHELAGTNTQIWVTGHSLGAALATLLVADLMNQIDSGAMLNLAGLVTFGSPRVGNTTFSERFDEVAGCLGTTVLRLRNENDMVTDLPFVQDWLHVGQLAYLTEGNLELGLLEEPAYGWGGSLDHHVIDAGYYARLRPLLDDPAFAKLSACTGGL